ncbi:MAG TPA: coproporphyrinogen III oxidase [Oscillatoriaceae cyanobacterium M33_DOE_052]|uniref:Heme chaperone HemW n=1 Tax=Planktothricoides sp. SpSt-374 TaxID=2282167 RepID=A0A7C3ZMI2_9CYAN|nr:coproporphyrinogen III oxidase [Oscillatoriaceae cyanobacterium M33_DOE_052]
MNWQTLGVDPVKVERATKVDITSAYVHIPFCRRRCFYCDFPVSVVGDRASGDQSGTIVHYVEFLLREIASTPTRNCQPLTTIFFGGGTPSLLSVGQLEKILAAIDRRFGISDDAEISLEMDPGTFDREKLTGVLAAGVNRVSMGVQAFQDELLKVCGRSHAVTDIFAAVDLVCQVGVPDFSIDLISGLPHQTLAHWQESLATAIRLQPTHISCYDLIVEPHTPFNRYYTSGVPPLPDDETAANMYRCAQEMLTNGGYQHYEISNYALPGHQCHHNRTYWENRPYYGFGMGAASYIAGQRFTRPRKLREYYDWVEQFIANNGVIDFPITPPEEVVLETLMLGLRLTAGIKLASLEHLLNTETSQRFWQRLQPYQQRGWVQLLDDSGEIIAAADRLPITGRLRLSDPEGFLFSNSILASLFE